MMDSIIWDVATLRPWASALDHDTLAELAQLANECQLPPPTQGARYWPELAELARSALGIY